MPSTNKTSHIGLSQFVSTDKLTMADYNADMNAIDTHIKSVLYTKSAVQSINNDAWTKIKFENQTYGYSNSAGLLYDTGSYTGIVVPAGYVAMIVTAMVEFPANTTGVRVATLYKNEAIISRQSIQLTNNFPTRLCLTAAIPVTKEDVITMDAYQNSGGALNISTLTQMGAILF